MAHVAHVLRARHSVVLLENALVERVLARRQCAALEGGEQDVGDLRVHQEDAAHEELTKLGPKTTWTRSVGRLDH